MVNPITFGSTYKFEFNNISNEKNKQKVLTDFCQKNQFYCDIKNEEQEVSPVANVELPKTRASVVVDNKFDTTVENFCFENGIEFKKRDYNSLMKPSEIEKRIAIAPEGKITARINIDKFDELAQKNSNLNLKYCEAEYEAKKAQFDKILKSGDEIKTAILYIDSASSLYRTFEYNGNYNKDDVMLNFGAIDREPNHCMYYALKAAGLEEIPVYVDEKSYQRGLELGLLK
jgi:hypothetical protein